MQQKELIKGNEKSFKDAILKVAQTTLNAAADTLAESMTKGLFGKFFTSPAQRMLNAMKEGGLYAARQIEAALKGEIVGSPTDLVKSGLENVLSQENMSDENRDQYSTTPTTTSKGIFGGFLDGLQNIFNPEGGFLKGLKGIFSTGLEGFGNIFSGLFGGGEGGGLFSAITSIFGFASGGVMTSKGKMSGYSTGGIARGSQRGYPAILHGTEAVVPLPNGKSIPVEMNKNSQQTQNNIVVNVTTDGRVSREGSTGPDMDKMGGAIAKAVQIELQNQKRSGGILSPYGPA